MKTMKLLLHTDDERIKKWMTVMEDDFMSTEESCEDDFTIRPLTWRSLKVNDFLEDLTPQQKTGAPVSPVKCAMKDIPGSHRSVLAQFQSTESPFSGRSVGLTIQLRVRLRQQPLIVPTTELPSELEYR